MLPPNRGGLPSKAYFVSSGQYKAAVPQQDATLIASSTCYSLLVGKACYITWRNDVLEFWGWQVASYPFTTLRPQLGTVAGPFGARMVVADIPGLVTGAAANKGLGHAFLRHVERTSLLVFVIDVSVQPELAGDAGPAAQGLQPVDQLAMLQVLTTSSDFDGIMSYVRRASLNMVLHLNAPYQTLQLVHAVAIIGEGCCLMVTCRALAIYSICPTEQSVAGVLIAITKHLIAKKRRLSLSLA